MAARSLARWYVLLLYTSIAIMQAATWNFYSPISDAVKKAYGWDDNLIAWLSNCSALVMFILLPVTSWAIDSAGVRPVMLFSSCCLFLCCVLRCLQSFPSSSTSLSALMFSSMVFNGASSPFLNAGAVIISSLWFPIHERATATAIGIMGQYIGMCMGFILGPFVISNSSAASTETLLADLKRLYIGQAVVTGITFAATVAYFPSRPKVPVDRGLVETTGFVALETPLAPSLTDASPGAGVQKPAGLRVLFTCFPMHRKVRAVWLVSLASALPMGFYYSWLAVLNLVLDHVGISRHDSAWLGFWMNIAGCASAIVVGRIVDKLRKHLRLIISGCCLTAGLSMIWFTLAVLKKVPDPRWVVFGAAALVGLCVSAAIPLMYELVLEVAHPVVPDGLASGLLTTCMVAAEIVLLGVSFAWSGDSFWLNWLLISSLLTASIVFSFSRFRVMVPLDDTLNHEQ